MAKDKDKEDEGPPGAGTIFVYRGAPAGDDWSQLVSSYHSSLI